jgi:predicted aldo/keto reductase-like oxidoreductase
MQRRKLGRTGLQVSVIGFGGIPIIALSREEAEKVVRYAFDRGVNYFDTARVYGDSEEKIGAALEDVRDKVVIATKTHQRTKEAAARAGLKQSLRKLRTDRIDIVQLHGIDDEETLKKAIAPEGSLTALETAKADGKVDYIGITGHNPWLLVKAVKTGKFDTVLVPLNVIDRRASEELIPIAEKRDVGVVIMKPLGGCGAPLQYPQWGSRFLGKPDQDWPDSSEFVQLFGREGRERAERSLRFVLAHDVATVVPGMRSQVEVDYAVETAEGFSHLTSREKAEYRFGSLPSEPYCRECGVCMHCPDGIKIATVLRWNTYHEFYGVKKWTQEQYRKLSARVDSCSECRECETKCPYRLPVMRMLKDAEENLSDR